MENNSAIPHNDVVEYLGNFYPTDKLALTRLCYRGLKEPLGYRHPQVVKELLGVAIKERQMHNL